MAMVNTALLAAPDNASLVKRLLDREIIDCIGGLCPSNTLQRDTLCSSLLPYVFFQANIRERAGFTPTFFDSVADNAACGGFLLGSKLVPLDGLDLRYIAMLMTKNGGLVNSGAGVEVMGDPVNAVAWLANTLSEHGGGLKAGQVVLSGAITAAEPVQSGDSMTVCFSTLGQISVTFC